MARYRSICLTVVGLGLLGWTLALTAEEPAKPAQPEVDASLRPQDGRANFDCAPKPAQSDEKAAPRPEPQPLSDFTKKGLAYLAAQQNADGGWGQGGGWRTGGQGRVEGADVKDPSDMGNSCISVLTLLRAGNVPGKGEYAAQVTKGIDFICTKVEAADRQSIWVTDVRDTQLQSKIGQYVDTFLAALVLSELKPQVAADRGGSRIEAALKKVIAKIEGNQKEDGTFEGNRGWASVLSQGLASKALNRAVANGVAVRQDVLKRDFDQAKEALASSGGVKADPAAKPVAGKTEAAADAGVKLYAFSANAGRISDQKEAQAEKRREVEKVLGDKDAPAEQKAQAGEKLKQLDEVERTNTEAVDGLIKNLDDENFRKGFGNNGGEEFLSYMNLSEIMLAKGGTEWLRWNKSIAEAVAKAQNGDGSWSGHHCITGRTFCTAAALLTVMADRAPVPQPK